MNIRFSYVAVIVGLLVGCGSTDSGLWGANSGGKAEGDKPASGFVLVTGRVSLDPKMVTPMSDATIEVKLYRQQAMDEEERKPPFKFMMTTKADGSFSYQVPLAADGGQSTYGTAIVSYQGDTSQIVRFNVPAHLKSKVSVEITCDVNKKVHDRFSCLLSKF